MKAFADWLMEDELKNALFAKKDIEDEIDKKVLGEKYLKERKSIQEAHESKQSVANFLNYKAQEASEVIDEWSSAPGLQEFRAMSREDQIKSVDADIDSWIDDNVYDLEWRTINDRRDKFIEAVVSHITGY